MESTDPPPFARRKPLKYGAFSTLLFLASATLLLVVARATGSFQANVYTTGSQTDSDVALDAEDVCWRSSLELLDVSADDASSFKAPSFAPVEFARVDLFRDLSSGRSQHGRRYRVSSAGSTPSSLQIRTRGI